MRPLVILSFVTMIAWGAWSFVVVRFDPFIGGLQIRAIFYASLACALCATLLIVGLQWFRLQHGRPPSKGEAGMIVRQAGLFTGFVLTVLLLAAYRLLHFWNLLPLALLTLVIELFFSSLTKRMRGYRSARLADLPVSNTSSSHSNR